MKDIQALEKELKEKKEKAERARNELKDIKERLAAERKRVKEEERNRRLEDKERPFLMQAAKEKELRQYIKAMRLNMTTALQEKGFTLKEIKDILGVSTVDNADRYFERVCRRRYCKDCEYRKASE